MATITNASTVVDLKYAQQTVTISQATTVLIPMPASNTFVITFDNTGGTAPLTINVQNSTQAGFVCAAGLSVTITSTALATWI